MNAASALRELIFLGRTREEAFNYHGDVKGDATKTEQARADAVAEQDSDTYGDRTPCTIIGELETSVVNQCFREQLKMSLVISMDAWKVHPALENEAPQNLRYGFESTVRTTAMAFSVTSEVISNPHRPPWLLPIHENPTWVSFRNPTFA